MVERKEQIMPIWVHPDDFGHLIRAWEPRVERAGKGFFAFWGKSRAFGWTVAEALEILRLGLYPSG